MLEIPWENSDINWNILGADGRYVKAEDVMQLLSSKTEQEALNAYWKLDGNVCFNGVLYGNAHAVTALILSSIYRCSEIALRYCLELLGQITVAEADKENIDIKNKCLEELYASSWFLFYGLQYDKLEHVWLYVDLLCILGSEYQELRPRIKNYLSKAMNRNISDTDISIIKDTLAGLNL